MIVDTSRPMCYDFNAKFNIKMRNQKHDFSGVTIDCAAYAVHRGPRLRGAS